MPTKRNKRHVSKSHFIVRPALWWMLLYTVAVAVFVDTLHLSFMISTLLFFGVPSIWFSFHKPHLIKKVALFMLMLVGPIVFIFDYLAYRDNTWFVPNSLFRFLGNAIPIEDAVWAILWVYYGIMFWEYFLDTEKSKRLFPRSIWILFGLCVFLLVIFFLLYFLYPVILYVPYFYLALGIVFGILPIVYVLVRYPRLLPKLLFIAGYFFVVSLLTEVVGLRQYQWVFTGSHYLAVFQLFGHRIPFEEMLFWFGIGIPSTVCWYEFFADDRR